jgi:hypothetical protein
VIYKQRRTPVSSKVHTKGKTTVLMYAEITQPGEVPGQGIDDDCAPAVGNWKGNGAARIPRKGTARLRVGLILKGRGTARRLPPRSLGRPLMATTPAGTRRRETVAAAAVFSTRGRRRAGDTAGQAPSVSGRERTCLRAVERAESGHGEEKEKGRVGLLVCWTERKKKKGFSYWEKNPIYLISYCNRLIFPP